MDELATGMKNALKMFYNEGFDSEELLIKAHQEIGKLYQPSKGLFYIKDVMALIANFDKGDN